jgi:hypothetical protein
MSVARKIIDNKKRKNNWLLPINFENLISMDARKTNTKFIEVFIKMN